ncbi:MAG TPA: GlsB/YeaQ/YmgE family stress response membrane protein, partial [Albitalea sp.]|nr:GlsB/YeaQ/YmgE family stress response membrane protein [Albitalea sp.]
MPAILECLAHCPGKALQQAEILPLAAPCARTALLAGLRGETARAANPCTAAPSAPSRPAKRRRRHADCRASVEASCRFVVVAGFPSIDFERTTSMINFIVWLVVGGLVGWIASMIMRTDAQQGVL